MFIRQVFLSIIKGVSHLYIESTIKAAVGFMPYILCSTRMS